MGQFLLALALACAALGQQNQPSQQPAPEEHPAPAEPPTPAEQSANVFNVLIDRFAFRESLNFGYTEWFQIRPTRHPRWSILGPDIGFLFFGDIGRYREMYLGAGFEVSPTRWLVIDNEVDLEQATGPDAHGNLWYVAWTRFELQLPRRVAAETVLFPYMPLNGGPFQLVIERSKLEYRGFKHVSFGGGYAGNRNFSRGDWQHKPFATITWKTEHEGQFEFWLQRLPNNGYQFQGRHMISWHSH